MRTQKLIILFSNVQNTWSICFEFANAFPFSLLLVCLADAKAANAHAGGAPRSARTVQESAAHRHGEDCTLTHFLLPPLILSLTAQVANLKYNAAHSGTQPPLLPGPAVPTHLGSTIPTVTQPTMVQPVTHLQPPGPHYAAHPHSQHHLHHHATRPFSTYARTPKTRAPGTAKRRSRVRRYTECTRPWVT